MVKKTLLSLAIAASTAGLTACNISSTADNNEVATNPVTAGTAGNLGLTTPVFSAANKTLPLINDLLFANASVTDGTASAGDSQPPVTTALNSIEGASLVAPIDIEFTADLDAASIQHPLAVRLIKLRNSEDDPRIDALDLAGSISPVANEKWEKNPIDSEDDQPVWGTDYTVSSLSLDGGETSVLRINLINPLDPKTKYIVALTNKISDSKGNTVARSSEYALVSGNLELPSEALAPVRGAVQGWEYLAGLYLNSAALKAGISMTQDDIVLSYAFTTGGTTEVLTTIAAPQLFVEALASKPETAESLYLAAIKGGAMQGGMSEADAGEAAFTNWMTNFVSPIVASQDDLTIADSENPTAAELDAVRKNATYQTNIVGTVSNPASGIVAGITATLATPSAQEYNLIKVPGTDMPVAITATQAGTLAAPVPESMSDSVSFRQGQIKLPSGLSAPAMTNAAALASGNATTIGSAVKLSYATDSVWSAEDQFNPPSDNMKYDPATGKLTSVGVTEVKDADGNVTGYTGGMTNVTYRYPLVELDQAEYAPVLMTVPSSIDYTAIGGQDCSSFDTDTNKFPTMIYVHGITSDRTSSIGIGTALAINCYVTVAMDLPLHGVAPVANDRDGSPGVNRLTFNIDQTAATSPFGASAAHASTGTTFANFEERHRNIASQAGTNARVAMDFDGADVSELAGTSGAFFINLGNMGRLRDNMRQAVVDLMHLNATIGSIDIDGDGDADLDTDKVYLSGNSLGAILGATFVAVNNSAAVQSKNGLSIGGALPLIQATVLASPGASLPKMLENSPAFSTNILGGLNLAQDSSSLQKYESMMQAALNSVDPINFASTLRTDDTPILTFNMIGGGDCPNFDLAEGTCGDGTDRIPTAIIQAFRGVYPPDHVVPNDDYFKAAETNAYVNVMPGLTFDLKDKDGMPTEVAMRNLDSSKMPLAGTTPLAEQMGLTQVNSTNIATATFNKKAYIPFDKGSHVTFVAKDDSATFTTMVTQMLTFFGSKGANLQPATADGIAADQADYTPVQ